VILAISKDLGRDILSIMLFSSYVCTPAVDSPWAYFLEQVVNLHDIYHTNTRPVY
jgi:ubiquinone biosynthesis protein Coq4